MKKFVLAIVAVLFTLCSLATYANQYTIIIDAGSSGSRLHLFQYQKDSHIPVIHDIFSESIKPGLSSFENNPAEAGKSLKTLLDDVMREVRARQLNPTEIDINVLATAGMRLLPVEKQQAIYTSVKNFILENNDGFYLGHIETISGQMEALYGWLDINYLANRFQFATPTLGSIDMGGASTQIAFNTSPAQHSNDVISVNVGNQLYTVFAKSFLGLGQDQAREALLKSTDSMVCFPAGYHFNQNSIGHFNLANCEQQLTNLIEQYHVNEQIIPTKIQEFVAYSGIFYNFQFFNIDKAPNQIALEKQLQSVCTKPWAELQADYPQISEKYLSTYCAHGVYFDELLYNTYQLQHSQLTVVTQIGQHDIDWTLGAMLFSLLPGKH